MDRQHPDQLPTPVWRRNGNRSECLPTGVPPKPQSVRPAMACSDLEQRRADRPPPCGAGTAPGKSAARCSGAKQSRAGPAAGPCCAKQRPAGVAAHRCSAAKEPAPNARRCLAVRQPRDERSRRNSVARQAWAMLPGAVSRSWIAVAPRGPSVPQSWSPMASRASLVPRAGSDVAWRTLLVPRAGSAVAWLTPTVSARRFFGVRAYDPLAPGQPGA